jgi:hypothetical protein
MAGLSRYPTLWIAALVALLATDAPAGTSDCLYKDGFDDIANPCASVAGCPVPVPNPAASQQIGNVRQLPDGIADSPIAGALVTYRKPAIGNDPAGFFVQAAQAGPALFIAVDPATLVPPPVPGDRVDFRVTQMATALSLRQAAAVSDWSVLGNGGRVECLVQDVSLAADLVSNLGAYESEVVRLDGTVSGNFTSAGAAFEAATMQTAGITGDGNLRLRLPATLRDGSDVVQGCGFSLEATPMWRANAVAQPSAWAQGELTIFGCPAPVVTSAVSTGTNSVRIDFSRRIDPATVLPNGSQFALDQGLAALKCTTPQSGAATYTATVANSIQDLQGTALGTPNSAVFQGFQLSAALRVNELNANVTNGCDLVELRVTTGGNMAGIVLRERVDPILTFSAFQVQSGDIVVVHFNAASASCNPGSATAETTSVAQQPAATFPGNYDTAFDWHIADTGITNTDNVLTLYAPDGSIMDAVFASDDPTGTAAAATETQAAAVAAAGQWQVVGGGIPPGGFVDDNFNAHAVQDLNGTAIDRNGISIQRSSNVDSNDLLGWGMATSSFGAANSGQVPFP